MAQSEGDCLVIGPWRILRRHRGKYIRTVRERGSSPVFGKGQSLVCAGLKVVVCLGLRGFLACGTSSAKTGLVPGNEGSGLPLTNLPCSLVCLASTYQWCLIVRTCHSHTFSCVLRQNPGENYSESSPWCQNILVPLARPLLKQNGCMRLSSVLKQTKPKCSQFKCLWLNKKEGERSQC